MLRWTIVFCIFSLIAGVFGFGDLALTTSNIARILFFVFMVMFVFSLLSGLFTGKSKVAINLALLIGLFTIGSTTIAKADETVGEKVHAVVNATARGVKKGANRIQESTCSKGELNCAALKAKNRAVETKDSVVDSIQETKNKID